jgi:hypothetical protein
MGYVIRVIGFKTGCPAPFEVYIYGKAEKTGIISDFFK